jgi:hypothetical protein
MLMSHHQNAGQNHDIKIANRSFENVAQFKHLATAVTNQNLIQEEIKRRLNSGNACYHSIQNLLSSHLLSEIIKIHSLTLGAEPFLRSRQLCSHSRASQHFMEPEGSLPCLQKLITGPYSEPDQPSPYHSILSL